MPAPGASVPETTVYEDCNMFARKEKVRASRYVLHSNLPTSNPISDQVRSETQFRCCIGSRLDCLHIAAAARCCFEEILHEQEHLRMNVLVYNLFRYPKATKDADNDEDG